MPKLMRIKNSDERRFYEIEAIKNDWSLSELRRQFDSALFERLDNVVALCPNCHRRIHAIGEEQDIQSLFDTIADYLKKEEKM